MGWGYLGEPDGGGIVEDGAHDGLVSGHQLFGREAPARAFMTLRALIARSTQSRAWGPKVKWVFSVTPRIIGVPFSGPNMWPIRTWGWSRDWWVSDVKVKLDFSGAMASCLPSAHLTSVEQRWLAPCLGLHDAGSRSQQSEIVGVGRHV